MVDLTQAQKKAHEANLDLVEIAPRADPPVVRILDFKKFKYEESKKERVAKKKIKQATTKEIWLGPLMGGHDLEVRSQQARHFLTEGDRVKFTVKFGGREIVHPEFGYKILDKMKGKISEYGDPDGEPRFVGRNLSLHFKPRKG